MGQPALASSTTEQPPQARSTWTAERVAIARRLWEEGLTAAQIARRMRTELGFACSRSAVLGIALRERFRSRRSQPSTPRRWPTLAFAQDLQNPEPADAAPIASEAAAGVPFLDVQPHQCRYPLGELDSIYNFRLCGRAKLAGSSYCHDHHLACHEGAL
jgi:GcrA cell cycle regulator